MRLTRHRRAFNANQGRPESVLVLLVHLYMLIIYIIYNISLYTYTTLLATFPGPATATGKGLPSPAGQEGFQRLQVPWWEQGVENNVFKCVCWPLYSTQCISGAVVWPLELASRKVTERRV